MASTAPIGVFDSGLGGISVAREIRRDMPNERVLYFGDSANAPYGTKSPEQVRELSDAIVKRFVEQGVRRSSSPVIPPLLPRPTNCATDTTFRLSAWNLR